MLSIITPVWNQGEEVKNNFLDLVGVLNRIKDDYEIILIDDGSTDDTLFILQEIQSRHPNIKIIQQKHFGQHLALFEGFKIAKGDIVVTIDADHSIHPKYILSMIEKLNEGYEIIVAWRLKRQGLGCIRRTGSLLINHYTNFITGVKVHEHGCSLKVFKGTLIKNNLHRKELKKFFGILIAWYARGISEIQVLSNREHTKDSSFTFLNLLLLSADFIFNSINMRCREALSSAKFLRRNR